MSAVIGVHGNPDVNLNVLLAKRGRNPHESLGVFVGASDASIHHPNIGIGQYSPCLITIAYPQIRWPFSIRESTMFKSRVPHYFGSPATTKSWQTESVLFIKKAYIYSVAYKIS